ncbi:MAG TPA: TetR/AcrR family transcriptional regulator [Thermodesulfovibrionales bacterium]|nr:TetR/AcrR family transcriptional regulator [Thermodesulfovibrionales bacterium]
MKTYGTKHKILEAGLKSFSREGYLGATTREIAREANVAEVTLFRHFRSKEMLFEEVISSYSFLPALRDLLAEIDEMRYEDALTLIARRFLETLTLRKDLIQIMHAEMHRYPGKIHKIYHAFIDGVIVTLASYFETMQKKRVLRKFDSVYGARAFLGMFFSYFNAQELMLRKKYRFTDTGKTIREFVGVFVKGTMK